MLIFDMDGTLIDSNGIWKDVDIALLKKRGFAYTRAYYEGVAHTIFPLAAKFTKEYCHLSESSCFACGDLGKIRNTSIAVPLPGEFDGSLYVRFRAYM